MTDKTDGRIDPGRLSLQAGGAEVIALATNTLHLVADHIAAGLDRPFVDLIDVVAWAVAESGARTVGLLATGSTMRSNLYASRFAKFGIEVLVPDPLDSELVHSIIYAELVKGVTRESSRAKYLAVIDRLVARGAEGIILGCTEIPSLVSQTDTVVPLYDTTELHCQALADIIVKGFQS